MGNKAFDDYMETQRAAIAEYKWNLGVAMGCDPGEDAVFEWIKKYAKKFRHDYIIKKVREAIEEMERLKMVVRPEIIDDCIEKLEAAIELEE